MKCLIISQLGGVQQILEKIGYFVVPTDKDNTFEIVFESVEELFHIADIINYDLLIHKKTSKNGNFVIEIFDENSFAHRFIPGR